MGGPDAPSFTRVSQTGSTTIFPKTDPAGAGSGDAATGRSTQAFTSTVSALFVSYRERPLRRALAVALAVADGLVTVVVALR